MAAGAYRLPFSRTNMGSMLPGAKRPPFGRTGVGSSAAMCALFFFCSCFFASFVAVDDRCGAWDSGWWAPFSCGGTHTFASCRWKQGA